jgi:hypothetical protein
MTEWMSHDGYGVEGQDVCSPASHQARCGVAFDMGHLWPAGHKWVQIGFTQRQVGVDRMLCGSSAVWSRRAFVSVVSRGLRVLGGPGRLARLVGVHCARFGGAAGVQDFLGVNRDWLP